MKLRFLFRSLYVPKENESFDEFTIFPDGSDLYLKLFTVVKFALILERHSVPLTGQC